ncbi:MAG: hypothetical protein KKB81_07120 [Candidatus Margulisbacteria bacterium]|nr:hypothetical protein [Candidatus Margulisiibacteriota bacterium]MBU1021914.1 hypothetical protein [Candidatus Margulisiibacteriota bacterium]MBU1728552.1 hypothetical protein [Candidatus Margulisiibacteriota bacterium]MBU1954699.1 hypothetical protein [Candidatus Margulisiibacteriota bacterium]
MKKTVFLICIIFMTVMGCAGKDEQLPSIPNNLEPDEKPAPQAQFTPISRVITKEAFLNEITLTFISPPGKVAPQTYAKLSGVVLGKNKVALFSLGSSNHICGEGEKIGNYFVEKIEEGLVLLRRHHGE